MTDYYMYPNCLSRLLRNVSMVIGALLNTSANDLHSLLEFCFSSYDVI